MYMKTLDFIIKSEDNHLLDRKVKRYDHNNDLKISASYNAKFAALSLACRTEYSTRNE